ncbi:MAG TPA: acyl-CoA dehydrogenase family protein [Geobacterales bacterium]|nr:acyl-CoA dehydrogenase family protein [Geobacterales bacterium]
MKDVYRFLSNAYDRNHYEIDKPFQTILKYFNYDDPTLSELGKFAGKELYEVADYVDKKANPKHVMWSIKGERIDETWLDFSERWVIDRLIRYYKVNMPPYKEGNWHKHYAMIYLIADPGIACIITVTNQTAYAIYKYGSEELKKYIPNLLGDAEPIMFGATWFTEIQGGSDLGANITEAYYNGNKWLIKGEKYFASNAGVADMALVTARPKGAQAGAKGLALFLVPEYSSAGKKNFKIRRLKEKSATISVPTGEVEFEDSEAYLLGEAKNGIYYTIEDLNVSRLANSAGALGIARKAFLEAYYYAQYRKAFGKSLIEHPLIQRDLLEMELLIEGAMALTFKAIDVFQKSRLSKPPYDANYHYARLLTHVAKTITAETAAFVSKMAMEILGGIGFLEEFPIARLHREALITPIWEGGSNIQALDMLEVIFKKNAHNQLILDMENLIEDMKDDETALSAYSLLKQVFADLNNLKEKDLLFNAKHILMKIGHSVAVIVLSHIGYKFNLERFTYLAKLYFDRYLQKNTFSYFSVENARELFTIEELGPKAIIKYA